MKRMLLIGAWLTSLCAYSQPITILGSIEDHKIVRASRALLEENNKNLWLAGKDVREFLK